MVDTIFKYEGTLDKFMGDGIMALWGAPVTHPDDSIRAVQCALEMGEVLSKFNGKRLEKRQAPLQVGIGIHTGPVVAGIIGHHKFIYDVWGDTVNVASRLEANGLPGRIQVSEAARLALAGRYDFESRGLIDLKGKGSIEAFLLVPPDIRGSERLV